MKLWRIAAETREYPADDLSGLGAAKNPGRWNAELEALIYTAPTISLAVLETAAHIDDAGLPQNRYLVELTVPRAIWSVRQIATVNQLPVGWDAIPAGRASVQYGSHWLSSMRSALLLVPSVIVPEEFTALINPAHPKARQISATKIRKFEYQRLLRL